MEIKLNKKDGNYLRKLKKELEEQKVVEEISFTELLSIIIQSYGDNK